MTKYLFAIACVLFVVSLPLRDSWAGKRLRFWALLLTVLAFGPPLVWNFIMHGGAARPSGSDAIAIGTTASAPTSAVSTSWRLILAGILVCGLAFLILALRRRLRPPREPWWRPEFDVRHGGTPVTGIPPAPEWPVPDDPPPPRRPRTR